MEVQGNPVQDWVAHWKAQKQPWRQEPKVGLVRQQFLAQRLQVEPDYKHDIYHFCSIPLARADVEWLAHKQKETDEGKRRQGLDLQEAILHVVDCTCFSLERARFYSAELEGVHFSSAQLSLLVCGALKGKCCSKVPNKLF